jgi:S-adenosylmethionine-dependent methyltransferase
MNIASATFDESIAKWTREQNQPWGKLKYRLIQSNLAKHLEVGNLHILDAGGGNGFDSIPLAEQGHTVDIVDYSTEMLTEAKRRATLAGVADKVTLHQSDISEITSLFNGQKFDLVLCHNVIQYAHDVHHLLQDLTGLIKTGGLMSVVSINRFSIPYHAAFMIGDLADALTKLDAHSVKTYVFNTTMATYSAEEVISMLRDVGCKVERDYGIRCMCDYWGDIERKSDPEVFDKIERLEFALTDKYPYKLLARYFQIIGRRD